MNRRNDWSCHVLTEAEKQYEADCQVVFRGHTWRLSHDIACHYRKLERNNALLLQALKELESVESSPHSETMRFMAREKAREAIRQAEGE